jgi:putative transposase
LRDLYGVDVSADLVSAVTDAVLEEFAEWQNRPLEPLYALVFFDAIRVKVRDEGMVRNKAVYVALGVRPDGTKEILGLWIEQTEGAKFWLRVMNELKNRGVEDVLIAVVDGLKGFPEAITAVYPGPDLHRSPDPQFAGLRFLQGPQGCRSGVEADLPSQGRRRRRGRTERLRRRPMGPKIPGNRPVQATPLERGHPVRRLSRRSASDHLYDG